MNDLPYLNGYPADLVERVRRLMAQDRLGPWLESQYPTHHSIQTDKALYQYVSELKQRYLKNTAALVKVYFDNRQNPIKGTLGTNTFVSRPQDGKLKSKNEIRIAALFRAAPEAFLRMIVIHELAHLKEKEHNKSFYQLCSAIWIPAIINGNLICASDSPGANTYHRASKGNSAATVMRASAAPKRNHNPPLLPILIARGRS